MNWNASWNKPKPYLPTSALNCANAPMVTGIKVSGAQISNSMGFLSHEDLVDEYVTIEKVKIIQARRIMWVQKENVPRIRELCQDVF